ncbi:hypothetical protein ACFVFD_17450 [Streptomyces fimicarius]|uniref:hypothetical protein n=1 Tax=Streptomyces griseus TaxID=1911 RepID=UPI0036AEE726
MSLYDRLAHTSSVRRVQQEMGSSTAARRRLKLFGRATAVPADENPALTERLDSPRTEGRVEQLVTVRVEAFAWNCPNHITPRFTRRELSDALGPVHDRIARLEQENAALRARLAT